MIALELTDIKTFMNKLLRTEVFDHFLLQEAMITSSATYTINGQITNGTSIAGNCCGTYRPPSGAKPLSTACALSTVTAALRVE